MSEHEHEHEHDVSIPHEPDPPHVSGRRQLVRAAIVVAIIVGGVALMQALINARPKPKRTDPDVAATMVETQRLQPSTQSVDVVATGTVVPSRQVILGAEVAGRVTWLSPDLVPGGRFDVKKAVLRVDARDYQLAVEQQQAQVTLAQTQLEVEKSRKRIAEKEWKVLGEPEPEAGSLARRDPQLKSAEGAVKAAESGLRRTRLAVEKTGITAPFNAMVLYAQVDLGQLVAPGAPLATLVGTDTFWVQVSIPVERLPWIDVPGVAGATSGSPAKVVQRYGEQVVERTGTVVRLDGAVDPVGRMARVLVEVEDPLGLKQASPTLPLLLNSFVEVSIAGKTLTDVYEVPRVALHDDDSVWLARADKLHIEKVDVLWRRRDTVLVRGGLVPGDAVVTSPVPAPVEGLRLREAAKPEAPSSPPTAEKPPAPAPEPASAQPAPEQPPVKAATP